MRIHSFKTEIIDKNIRASAKITWEVLDRKEQEIYFETDARFSDSFTCNPHSFLIACVLPALRFREKRIRVDAEICPDLREGLVTNMGWIQRWRHYKYRNDLVEIQAEIQKITPESLNGERAGLFFSGGIDSLATLRANRLNYDSKHPGYIKDGIVVCGLEVPKREKFDHVVNNLYKITADADINLIPIYTNIRELGPEDRVEYWRDFWILEYMSTAFAAIAHTFSKRFGTVYLSTDQDIPHVTFPYGNHPLLNPNYSSRDLQFATFGLNLSRLKKTKLICEWSTAVQNLRVCNDSSRYEENILNCGECEKCARTKLALLALGVLDKASVFENKDCSADLVKSAVQLNNLNKIYYDKEILDALNTVGQYEISSVLRKKLVVQKLRQVVNDSVIRPIKAIDRKYLNGGILKLKRSFIKKGLLE